MKEITNTNSKPLYLLIAVLFVISAIIACVQAPVTGRSQFMLISQAQETELGITAFNQILEQEKVSRDPAYNAAAKRVGNRIARVSHNPGYNWEFKVLEGKDVINAFALPGGKVAFYEGIMEVAQTDAGLATVAAHEIAHVTARHGGERMSTGLLAELGAVGVSAALGGQDPGIRNAVLQAYGVGVTVGGILPFSRKQESEADHIGLIYLARAGYDPREALAFWERMEKASAGRPSPPEFLATHPSHGTRSENIRRVLPEAMEIYRQSQKAPNNRIKN